MFRNRILLVLLLFSGCGINKWLAEGVTEQQKTIKFEADTSINNTLILRDTGSLSSFYSGELFVHSESKSLMYPAVFFSNRNNSQYLMAYRYYGDYKNSFSLFEVGFLTDSIEEYTLHTVNDDYFKTESGIYLGMEKQAVLMKKGNGFTVVSNHPERDESTIRYSINSKDGENKILDRYKLPVYFMEFTFEAHTLVLYRFGFEYP